MEPSPCEGPPFPRIRCPASGSCTGVATWLTEHVGGRALGGLDRDLWNARPYILDLLLKISNNLLKNDLTSLSSTPGTNKPYGKININHYH